MPEWYQLKPHLRLQRWKGSALGYCVYAGLCDHAFDLGGLPDNPGKVAAMTEIDIELIKEVWEAFKADCIVQTNGRLMPKEIVDADNKMRATNQKRRDAGKVGGHRSGESRRASKGQCQPNPFDGLDPAQNGHHPNQDNVEAIKQAVEEIDREVAKVCTDSDAPLSDALEKLFPGEAFHKILELGQLVMKVKGCPKDVEGWRDWMRVRHPNRVPTFWVFKDFFPLMVSESKTFTTGARFIIATSFHINATRVDLMNVLNDTQINLAITHGRMLDEMVGLATSAEWQARGLTTNNFLTYWQGLYSRQDYPKPEQVVKHWQGFTDALKAEIKESK